MKIDLYEYVKNYFQRKFPEYYLIFNESDMDGLLNAKQKYVQIVQRKISDKYSLLDVRNNNIDLKEIDDILNNYLNDYFTKEQREDYSLLCDYVRKILINQGFDENFSIDIFDHIVKLVASRLLPQYDESRLNTVEFNHIINLVYNNVYNQEVKKINDKVKDIIEWYKDVKKKKVVTFGGDAISLYESVASSVLINEDREFLNRLYVLVVNDSVKELSRTGKIVEKYICNYASIIDDKKISDSVEDNESTNDVDKHDDKIDVDKQTDDRVEYVSMVSHKKIGMRENSVQNSMAPKKVRLNAKQTKMAKMAITLAVLGTLIGGGALVHAVNQEAKDTFAVMRTEALSSFDFSKKVLRDNNFYNEMADEVIIICDKVSQLDNDNYKNIGLYYSYEGSVNAVGKQNSLSEMEDFFGLLKEKIVKEDISFEGFRLRDNVKADNSKYFYLDFVYDTLLRAGYYELTDDKYQNALNRYKFANFPHIYGVVDGISLTNSEMILINDVMDKYVEYYEDSEKEIGKLIASGKYTFFIDDYNPGKGK